MSYAIAELRHAVRMIHAVAENNVDRDHFYRVDRGYADEYFFGCKDWQQEVADFASRLHTSNVPAVHLDVCGNTTADALGFDHSYQFSMSNRRLCRPHTTACRGDIFNKLEFFAFLNEIEAERGKLGFTSFMPMAGLQSYTPKSAVPGHRDILYRMLFRQLAAVIDHTHIGGSVLLELPFQLDAGDGRIADHFSRTPFNQTKSHQTLKRWAKQLKCSVRGRKNLTGGSWLLRKDYKCLGPVP